MLFVNPLTALGMVDRLKELGSQATIISAGASQLGRMLIKLCQKENIVPICTVRKEAQAEMLRNDYNVAHVINTSEDDWRQKMGAIALQAKPTSCLECIAGDMTGELMNFLGMKGTVILYGLLSEQPAGNINVLNFIGKGLTLESYILTNDMAKKSPDEIKQFFGRAYALYTSDLASHINARFGIHQIREAVNFYRENQTAGKVLI